MVLEWNSLIRGKEKIFGVGQVRLRQIKYWTRKAADLLSPSREKEKNT